MGSQVYTHSSQAPLASSFQAIYAGRGTGGILGVEERETGGHVSPSCLLPVASLAVVLFPLWLCVRLPLSQLLLSIPCLMALVSGLPPTVPPGLAVVVGYYSRRYLAVKRIPG